MILETRDEKRYYKATTPTRLLVATPVAVRDREETLRMACRKKPNRCFILPPNPEIDVHYNKSLSLGIPIY